MMDSSQAIFRADASASACTALRQLTVRPRPISSTVLINNSKLKFRRSSRFRDPENLWLHRCPRCSLPVNVQGAVAAATRPHIMVRAAAVEHAPPSSEERGGPKKILVLGGTGRVGGSTVAALLRSGCDLDITVASRSVASFEAAQRDRPELKAAHFLTCDIDDAVSLASALQGMDLVIHCAGPFQWKEDCAVLAAAITAGTPYIDVCDDADYSKRAKSQYHEAAQAAGVAAITTAGIYPGTSNVMAAHMISLARKEYGEDGSYLETAAEGGVEPERLRFSYYTAGSGGVGPTILATSMLLAGEPVVAFKDGQRVVVPAISEPRDVDFGVGIGKRQCFLYNLPETESCFTNLRVPSVSARFGTAPFFWNWAMWLTARLSPPGFLQDREKATWLASVASPLVRAVDPLVGERVAMLVEVELVGGKIAAGLFAHRQCSETVGISIAAFARAVLDRETSPGVWYPEERQAIANRPQLLERASEGCFRFEMNKPPWVLGSNPKRFVMGIYFD